MKMPAKLQAAFRVPRLTWMRILAALGVALAADGIQFAFGLFGLIGVDPVIDLVAMVLTSRLLGFHWLLLPTFVLKLVPLVDDLPTWTACVLAVVAIRKREQRAPPPSPPVIDV